GANRASLMLQLPEVLKATEQMAREAQSGQVSLFGEGPSNDIRIELPEIADWPVEERLKAERDTLGFFLSGHPLDPWAAELKQLGTCPLSELEKTWQERKDRRGEAHVVVAGLISQMRKRGDNQAFVLIEDQQDGLECAFFSEAYQESATLLTRDRIVLIEGSLREDSFNGGFSLRAKHCWDFHALLLQYAKGIQCKLDLCHPDTWQTLQALLMSYRPGPTPVMLQLRTASAEGRLRAPAHHSVRCEAGLISRLRQIEGMGEVQVALARPWAMASAASAA
ncbi:MAG: OB-fold nucleic acid binding domain-containing protein, partial [Arenimonas sp.]